MTLPASSWLRAAIWSLAVAVFWWTLAPAAAVTAAMFAAFVASVGAEWAQPRGLSRLRSSAIFAGSALVSLLAVGAARLLVWLETPAALLGAGGATVASEVLLAFVTTAACVFAVRTLAARRPAAAALEVALAAAALVTALAAHRDGMVHLPLTLGDIAWTRGFDPTLLFLGLGGAALVLLAGLLLSEERRGRIPLHLAVVLLAALLLAPFVRLGGLPEPSAPEGLGLTGEAEQKQRGEGDPEQRNTRPQDDLAFRDEYPRDGGRAPVAVVVLHDDYAPPTGVYYFRQSAYSHFNGRRLVQAAGDDVDRDLVRSFPSARYEVPWSPPASERRVSLHTTTGLLIDHVRPFALDAPIALEPRANTAMRFQRVYEAVSLARNVPYHELLGGIAGGLDWDDATWKHYTAAPGDERYADLARSTLEWIQPEFREDPLARALAVQQYLERSGSYSRKSSHMDAEDPVASFLFGDLTGYCVHFAHAAVYMLRSLGVPSRVAAGYAVPQSDSGNASAVMIRGLNAHAWPEIHLAGIGWVVVDIAPERILDATAPPPDPALQNMLGELLRGLEAEEAFAVEPARVWPSLAAVAWTLVAVIAFAALTAGGVKLARRLAPRFAGPADLARVAYRSCLDRLADAGLRRRFGESRERFALRLRERAPSLEPLTREHLRHAWGQRRPADAGALRALEAAVARELAAGTPGWRRWLGTLNPFSWLRVH